MKVGCKVFIGTFVLGLAFVGMILLISSLGDKGKTDSLVFAGEMGDVPQITSRVVRDEVYTDTNKDGPIKVTINLGGLTNTIEAQ
ncbi:MAG: hypothetical protein WCP24_01595 [bacterium]